MYGFYLENTFWKKVNKKKQKKTAIQNLFVSLRKMC
jgi:hypothetical protein